MRSLLGVLVAAVFAAGVITAALQGSEGRASTPHAAAATTAGPSTSGAPVDPDAAGVVQPPTPGVYQYRSTRLGWAERVSLLDPKSSLEQVIATNGINEVVQYTPGAVLELRYADTGTSVSGEITCVDDTPIVRWQMPFADHRHWESTANCTNLLGQQVSLRRVTDVTGPTTLTLHGASIPVWELVTVSTLTSPKTGSTITTTEDIAASRGVVVRRVTQDGSDPKTLTTDTIESLAPA